MFTKEYIRIGKQTVSGRFTGLFKVCAALCVLSITAFGKASAQSVTVDAYIDSLQILIGDQARIRLEVSLDADKHALLPHFPDTLVTGVEVLEESKPDTQMLNKGKRMALTREYVITSFDSALYYLPPLVVWVDSQAYRSKPLALKVYTIPVDTLHPEEFYGPKTVMRAPFAWEDWYLAIAAVVLFVPVLLLVIYLVKRLRDNKPIIRKVRVEPKRPPHVLAMEEIERIKQERVWQKGQSKAYYTELTDTLRTYIRERFGFNAMEMTSTEIIDKLLEQNDRDAIRELQDLFRTADLVKFAKFLPLMDENDANLIHAVDFVNGTKVEEPEGAAPQPTEITIVEKRSLRTKLLLGAAVVVLGAALVWALVYVVMQLYNFFA